MKITINLNKKGYVIEYFDRRIKKVDEVNDLSAYVIDSSFKQKKVNLLISRCLVNIYKASYPIMSKKKLREYHLKKYRELYNDIKPYTIKITKAKNHFDVTSYHFTKEVSDFLNNHLKVKNITLASSIKKEKDYLKIDDYELRLVINCNEVYYSSLNDFNVSLLEFNVLKAIYSSLFCGTLKIINNSADKKTIQLINYLRQNVEKQVEIIEI